MVSTEYANDAEVLMFLSECWRCQFGAFFASLRLNKHLNLSRMKNFFKTACLTFIICYTPTSNMFIIIYTVCHHLKPVRSISAPNAILYPLKYTYSSWETQPKTTDCFRLVTRKLALNFKKFWNGLLRGFNSWWWVFCYTGTKLKSPVKSNSRLIIDTRLGLLLEDSIAIKIGTEQSFFRYFAISIMFSTVENK